GADAKATAGRDDQWQMHEQARVAYARMWRDTRLGVAYGKYRRRRIARNVASGPCLERSSGARAARQIGLVRHALAPKVVDTPAAEIVQVPEPACSALGMGDIGSECLRTIGKHVQQFL